MHKANAVILATVALDTLGIGLIWPILPGLVRDLGGGDHLALHVGLLMALYAAMQFVFAPLLGVLSDRFGRRPVLLIALGGAAVDYLAMAFAPTLTLVYIARAIAGLCGATMAVAAAYIADSAAPAERARWFGYMNALFGVGFVAGPVLGGLLGEYSVRYPFVLAAVLNGVNFLVGWLVLPESHTRGHTKADGATHQLNPLATARWAWSLRPARALMAVHFVMNLIGHGTGALWVIYTEARFGWSAFMVGLSFACFGAMHAGFQAVAAGPLSKALGERRLLWLALGVDAVAYVAFAFIANGWYVFPLCLLFSFGSLATTALQSILSQQVDESRQGELQGALTSLVSLGAIIAPLASTAIYSGLPPADIGLVWLVSALGYALCPLALLVFRQRRAAAA